MRASIVESLAKNITNEFVILDVEEPKDDGLLFSYSHQTCVTLVIHSIHRGHASAATYVII